MERNYLDLIREIIEHGEESDDRTGVGTKRLFGKELRFDISKSFPLYTTRKIYFKGVIEELLWFLRGDTDSKILEESNVNIWQGNTTRSFLDNRGLVDYPEGEAGANYSWQWRNYGGTIKSSRVLRVARNKREEVSKCIQKRKDGVDQIANVIESLKNDPFGRRHMVVAWNPLQLDLTPLPPCHYAIQFFVSKDKGLSALVNIRSQDVALGNPFNVASYSAMVYILSKVCGYTPKELIIYMGDTHVYKNHIEPLREQIERDPYEFPTLEIEKDINSIEDVESLKFEDFKLENYKCHPAIKMKMAV